MSMTAVMLRHRAACGVRRAAKQARKGLRKCRQMDAKHANRTGAAASALLSRFGRAMSAEKRRSSPKPIRVSCVHLFCICVESCLPGTAGDADRWPEQALAAARAERHEPSSSGRGSLGLTAALDPLRSFQTVGAKSGGGRVPGARAVSLLSQNPDRCDGLRCFRAGPAKRLRPAAAAGPRAGGGAEVIRPPWPPERLHPDRARPGLPSRPTAGSVSSASCSPACVS